MAHNAMTLMLNSHMFSLNWLRGHRRERASLTALLARGDDHLLDDIGLTRTELESLAGTWRAQ